MNADYKDADVAILYLDEHEDAHATLKMIEAEGRKGLLISGDVGDSAFCQDAVQQTVDALGGLNVLVNNAAGIHRKRLPTSPPNNYKRLSIQIFLKCSN